MTLQHRTAWRFHVALVSWLAALCVTTAAQAQAGRDPRVGLGPDGLPALRRVGVVDPQAAEFGLVAGAHYGLLEAVVDDRDAHHILGGRVAGNLRVADQVALGLRLDGLYITHSGGPADGDTGGITRSLLSVRGDFELGPRLRLGAEGRVAVPASQQIGRSLTHVSPEAQLLLTFLPGSPRLLVSSMLGLRLDNSADAIEDPDAYSPSDRAVLGMGSGPALLAGLGLSYRSGPIDVLAEWSWDAYLGSQAPELAASPMHLTGGVRLWLSRALHLDLLGAVSPSSRPDVGTGEPLQVLPPRYWLGASFGMHFREAELAPPPVVPTAPAAPGSVEGVVRGPDGAPIAGATVRYGGPSGERELRADAEGRFQIGDLPPGEHELRVDADGFEPFSMRVTVGAGETATPEVVLEPPLPQGVIRGTIHDFRGRPVQARIRIEPTGVRLRTDDAGEFEVEVAPGEYKVTVRAKGYRTEKRNAKVHDNGVAVVLVNLRRR